MADDLRAERGPFTMVPDGVLLEADLSDRAFRLWVILRRRADYQTGECYPSRSWMAERLRCSRDTVDRAMTELLDLGAVTKESRYDDRGDQTSNLYVVRWFQGRTDAEGGRTDAEGGSRTDAAPPAAGVRPNLDTPDLDQEGSRTAPVVAESSPRGDSKPAGKQRRTDPRSDVLTREWWDALEVKPVQTYVAARGVVDRALKAGWTETELRAVLRRIDPPLSGGRLDYVRGRMNDRPGAGAVNQAWDRDAPSTVEYR